MNEETTPTASSTAPLDASKTHRKRKWLKMFGVVLLAFASYHIGWWRAMNYFGATWDTPKGGLHQAVAPSQLPSHLLVCGSTLPKQCYDYRCPLGTNLVNPEQYSITGGGSRQKECSDGSIATEVQMKVN
jgi:hypothetical protein